MASPISHKFTLTRHTKTINALAVDTQGSHLLSAGNDSHVVIWNLSLGEMVQEFCVPSAGYISCLAWVRLADHDDSFVFGASDGNIHLYQRLKDSPLWSFSSISSAHAGAIESFAWDQNQRRLATVGAGEVRIWKVALDQKTLIPFNTNVTKQSYVARSVHFTDDGNSVLVCYLESGSVWCYSVDPWDVKWNKKTDCRIGDSYLDGQQLLVSNLRDGVDKYLIPSVHRSQSYHHTILVNVPLQLSVARECGIVVVGGDNGFARIFDYHTGALRQKLDHGGKGELVPVVTSFEGRQECLIITGSALDGHNNIKVWAQGSRAEVPRHTVTEDTRLSGLSLKQFIIFTLLCILVNVVIAFLPTYIPPNIPVPELFSSLYET